VQDDALLIMLITPFGLSMALVAPVIVTLSRGDAETVGVSTAGGDRRRSRMITGKPPKSHEFWDILCISHLTAVLATSSCTMVRCRGGARVGGELEQPPAPLQKGNGMSLTQTHHAFAWSVSTGSTRHCGSSLGCGRTPCATARLRSSPRTLLSPPRSPISFPWHAGQDFLGDRLRCVDGRSISSLHWNGHAYYSTEVLVADALETLENRP
jgi:hypothetical protein